LSSQWKNKDFRDKKKKQSQAKWKNKRKKRYDQTVWKGWSDKGESSPVTTYHISELEEKKDGE
jgi:hypothetical protein